jgi:hypothetical protein
MRPKYSSPRSRDPAHWGKHTWDALFLLASDYPHERDCADDDVYPASLVSTRRRAWKQLLTALPGVLTCGACAYHFDAYLKRNGGRDVDDALRDRKSLFRWLYACKDEVNKRTQRRSPTLDRVRRRYISECSRSSRHL